MAKLHASDARQIAAAKRLAARGDPDKACARLRKAVMAADADSAFCLHAARFLHDHGDCPGAYQAVNTCLQRRPWEPKALRLRCLIALEEGKAAAAANDLVAVIAMKSAPAQFRVVAEAGLLRLRGRPAAALALLEPRLEQDPHDLAARREEIRSLVQQGAYGTAAARVAMVQRHRPDIAHALEALCAAAMPSGTGNTRQQTPAAPQITTADPDRLRRILTDVIRERPEWPRPYGYLARLELEQGNPQAALVAIISARVHVPESQLPYSVWARALLALGRSAEAKALAERLGGAGQGAWRLFYIRARVAAARGDRAAEVAALREGLHRFPGNMSLLKRLIRSCLSAQIPPAAMIGWQALFAPQDRHHVAALEIESCLKRCDFDQALTLLRRQHPALRSPRRARWIAQALAGLNRDRLATRYLRRTLRHWPSDKRLTDEYLRILLRRDRTRAAMRVFKRTGYADRHGLVAAAEQQVQLYLRAGRPGDALKALDVLERADRVPWARLPFVLRAVLAEGDTDSAARVEKLIARDPRSTAEQAQKTLHGQILSEYRLLGAAPADPDTTVPGTAQGGVMTPIDTAAPDALTRLAGLVTAAPTSSIAAMRLLRHWTRHGADVSQDRAGTGAPMPQQVFQYWDDPEPPTEVRRMVASWQRLPGHVHHLLDRHAALARLRADFGPYWVQAFLRASKVAEESDFLRLCLLARDGGIYADTDDIVTGKPRSLARLIHGGAGLVVCIEPVGAAVGNNFIAATPGHPAIVLAARQARQAMLVRANESAWSKTGPGLLSRAVALYIAREVLAERVPDVAVIPRARVLRHVSFHNRLPYKATAMHWKNSARAGEAAALEALLHDLLAPRKAA